MSEAIGGINSILSGGLVSVLGFLLAGAIYAIYQLSMLLKERGDKYREEMKEAAERRAKMSQAFGEMTATTNAAITENTQALRENTRMMARIEAKLDGRDS